ncbi:hypothetical protein GCM10007981_13350 [Thermocladium modestius]|uniref:t-SNARE coiled-coil homology domain-containing protein n=1 Tax=Thermocladium modestius TaxID=62609 RepID=A0A830GXU5_9CREN|nr:hypothetical protein [Thermocladium modestius]GGP21456.1 hypothetical protein GCM10007981_13350 [Thermocladium modestius]
MEKEAIERALREDPSILIRVLQESEELRAFLKSYIGDDIARKDDIKTMTDILTKMVDQNAQLMKQLDKRFEEVIGQMDKRFDDMDKRFDDMNRHFEEMINQLDKRFDQMDKRFIQVDRRLSFLEKVVIGLYVPIVIEIILQLLHL